MRAGGYTTTTVATSETFDGSTWAANTALSTARKLGASATNSGGGEGLAISGHDGSVNIASTEEWYADLSKTVTDTATGADALILNGTITIADTITGADALILNGTITIADTITGADALSLPLPMPDTGSGVDAISVAVYVVIAEAPTTTDGFSLVSKYLPIADTITGADLASPYTGDRYIVADTGTGTDAVSVVAYIPISDTAGGLDAITVSGNTAVLLLTVLGFPSGQTVQYRIEDGDGNLVQDWTASGVQEYARGDGKSRYRVWQTKLANGVIDWRIPSTTYYASESFNIYGSLSDGVGYTSTRASKLDNLNVASSTLATQASVNAIPTTPLLAADYTAPDSGERCGHSRHAGGCGLSPRRPPQQAVS